jgi:hypothetical protein
MKYGNRRIMHRVEQQMTITDNQAEAIARREENEKIQFETSFLYAFYPLLTKMARAALSTYDTTLQFLDLQTFDEDVVEILSKEYDKVERRVSTQMVRRFKREFDIEDVDIEGLQKTLEGDVKKPVVQNAGFVINTLQKILNNDIVKFEQESKIHVKASVANTQTQVAYETVKQTTFRFLSARYPILAEKGWFAVLDDRTRQWHREAHGTWVQIGLDFQVGPDKMSRPGDPSASIANLAGCRCSLVYRNAN